MTLAVFVGTSLDGFIARANGAFDFLNAPDGDAEPHGYEEFFATVDTLLMGARPSRPCWRSRSGLMATSLCSCSAPGGLHPAPLER